MSSGNTRDPDGLVRDERTATPARRYINYVDSDLHLVVDDACAALVDAGAAVYARGTVLVVPITLATTTFDRGVRRPEGSPILATLTKPGLAETLTRHAQFMKPMMGGTQKRIPCPPVVAETIIARQGDWPFPQLRAIVSTPTLRPDGTVIDIPGFDRSTGILFVTSRQWPAMRAKPTRDDALRGLGKFKALLASFPFVLDTDLAATLALILTALIRPSLPTAPLFGVSAPTPGTGKSKLVDIAAILSTGRPAAVMSASREETELKKQIDAALMAGDSFLSLDNIDHPLRSEFLCQVLTQITVKSRVLGESRNLDLPTGVTMCATGNSLRFVGDLTRRVVLINLDARTERPEDRIFASDPIAIAQRDRVGLVMAGLTILRAEGARLLANADIAGAIRAKTGLIAASLAITAERVLAAIASIAFSDTRRLFDGARLKRPDEWDDATANAVASLELSSAGHGEGSEQVGKVRFADRLKALDMLARHLSLYNDKLAVNVADGLADRVARAKARGADALALKQL